MAKIRKMKAGFTRKEEAAWNRRNELRDSYRCRGRIKAEGKKAKPLLCFREKKDPATRHTVLELHSKVTGKQIGFFGGRNRPFVKMRMEAGTWDHLNARFAQDEFREFLVDARGPANTEWKRISKAALKEMEREARK